MKQLQEKFLTKFKTLCIPFLNLEKVFDSISGFTDWLALEINLETNEWLVKGTVSRTGVNNEFNDEFKMQAGVNESSLSQPTIILEIITKSPCNPCQHRKAEV